MSAVESVHERMLEYGAGALSDADLLAMLLGEKSRSLLATRSLKELLQRPQASLEVEPGLSRKRARTLHAAVELGRRYLATRESRPVLKTPDDIAAYLQPHLAGLPHEEFHVLAFNARNVLVKHERIAKGTTDSCPVDPRALFSACLLSNASAFVVAHNHPTGNSEPSPLDIQLTRNLFKGAETLNLKLMDHIVIGDDEFTSFLNRGLMPVRHL